MRPRFLFAAALLAAFHLIVAPAQAASPAQKANVSADLVVGRFDKTDPAIAWLGVDVHLGPGWHTYWRSAGDAGAPPEFDWSGSRNVAEATVEWPAPRRFSEDGIDTFGYVDHVLFPLKLRLQDSSAPAHLSLKLVLYVCSTICTQNDLQLETDVSPGAGLAGSQTLIDQWRSRVPRETSSTMSISALSLQRRPQPHLLIELHANPPVSAPDVFVDGDAAVAGGHPRVTQQAGDVALLAVPLEGFDQAHPDRQLRVTVVDGNRAIETVLPQQQSGAANAEFRKPVADDPHSPVSAIWPIIGLALIGGLILNFMPCVFPVLSLKLVALMPQGSDDVRATRTSFIASAAGVVASFLALAAVLSLLKSAGAQIGWGIQFQQPAFLIAMAAVLAAFGANLLGLFEVRLPWWLANSLGAAGSGSSILSHFVSGFVMTLLATPCSAPFVGTAVAFALSQTGLQTFTVFAGLGLGMASPYLLLAALPRLSRIFPRPGRWMLTLRRIAAAAMMATVVWLLTILAEISGTVVAVSTGATLTMLLLLLLVPRWRPIRMVAAGLAVLSIGIAWLAADRVPHSAAEAGSQQIGWRPFAPDQVAAMVRAGNTVFVDIGASWCVTCKVNEALVIDSAPVRRRLGSDVVPFRADWTRPSELITAYLHAFDRYGLPFNVVFGPGAPDGIVLPELLTQKAVLDAFDTAAQHASNP